MATTKKTPAKKAARKTAAKKVAKKAATKKVAKKKVAKKAERKPAEKARRDSVDSATLVKAAKSKLKIKNPSEKATVIVHQFAKLHSKGTPGKKNFEFTKPRKELAASLMEIGIADATVQTQLTRFKNGVHPKGFGE